MTENEQVWKYLETLTRIIFQLISGSVQAAKDAKELKRLQRLFDELRNLSEIYTAHFRTEPAVDATAELHERLEALEQYQADHEADKNRPVEIRIVKELPNA